MCGAVPIDQLSAPRRSTCPAALCAIWRANSHPEAATDWHETKTSDCRPTGPARLDAPAVWRYLSSSPPRSAPGSRQCAPASAEPSPSWSRWTRDDGDPDEGVDRRVTGRVLGDGTATAAGAERGVPGCGGIAGRAGTALEARAGVVLPGSYSGIVGVLWDEVPGMRRRRGARIGAIRGSCRCG